MHPVRFPASLLLLSVFAGMGCDSSGSGGGDPVATRGFAMGFTPWPYDANQAALDDTYTRIQTHGDIVAHHIMDGVPWDQALAGTAYPAEVEAGLQERLDQTLASQRVYLALDAVNGGRDGLADDWDSTCATALCPPWDGYAFDHPDVVNAYTHFALDLIARFDPDYFNIASEASELLLNDQDDGTSNFPAFVDFAAQVIPAIRARHPDLPILVSVAMKAPGSSAMDDLVAGLPPLIDLLDLVGISVYPYAFYDPPDGDPASLTADWLSQIEALSGGKPLAVTETGWIAEDLEITSFGLDVQSSPAHQDQYVELLLDEADSLDARFVIWFTIVDYDALWATFPPGAVQDLGKIWRDTGLFDQDLIPRAALITWDQAREQPLQ